MKDLGSAKHILRMSIIRDKMKSTLRLSQEKYIGNVLEKFNMSLLRLDVSLWETILNSCDVRYGTSKATICFNRKEVVIEGFFDLDYEGCLDSSKSTRGYVFTVGGTTAGKELVWMKNFLEELDRAQTGCVLFCDNQSAIHLAKNLMFHGRTKHNKIRYHYIRELVSEMMLSLKKILGAKNLADMLTKVVTTEKLKLYAASTSL
ncbi:hypothetical protein Tco_1519543 [Tanacetum coccineum]